MFTWKEKFAAAGIVICSITNDELFHGRIKVKTRIPGGLCSFGTGKTLEDALRDASYGFRIDWHQTERRMTENAWKQIAHL